MRGIISFKNKLQTQPKIKGQLNKLKSSSKKRKKMQGISQKTILAILRFLSKKSTQWCDLSASTLILY